MKVTHHAAKRFLERVIGMQYYGKKEIRRAYRFLEKETDSILVHNRRRHIALPSFKAYRAVIVDNTLVTIVPRKGVA